MIKISIIVPVYNVERYLPICLESIFQQSLSLFEVIIVDDGSTDNSGTICDNFAARHNEIRVIHQQNQGVSAARNRAINEAKGEYLVFIDADDFWVPNTLEPLLQTAIDNNLDVLAFNPIDVPENATHAPNVAYEPQPIEVNNGFDFVAKNQVPVYIFLFLVKRNHLITNCLTFPEGHILEDAGFSLRTYLYANRIAKSEQVVYCYRYRETSLIHSKERTHLIQLLDDFIYAAQDVDSIIKSKGSMMSSECYERFRTRRDSYVFFGAIRAFRIGKAKEFISKAKNLNLYPFKSLSETDYPGLKYKLLHWCICKPLLWNSLSIIFKLIMKKRYK